MRQAVCTAGGRHDCWIARVIVAFSETVFAVSDVDSVVGLDGSRSWKGKPRAQQGGVAEGDRRQMRGGLETPVDSWNGQGEQLVIEQRQRNTVIPSLRPQAIRLY